MSHELEIFADGRASFAHAWGTEPGWHSLGQQGEEGDSAVALMGRAGINWRVVMRELGLLVRVHESDGLREYSNGGGIGDYRAIVREDTGAVFGVASKGYKPVQNVELAEFFDRFAAVNGLKIDTVGTIRGGSRVWALARHPGLVGTVGPASAGDEITSFAMLAAGHDTTFGVRALNTAVRVVCANTWRASGIGGKADLFKMSHLQTWNDDMQRRCAEALGLQIAGFRSAMEAANVLAGRTCRDADAEAFYRRLLEMAVEAPPTPVAPAPLLDAVAVAPAPALVRAAESGSLLDTILGGGGEPAGADLASAGLDLGHVAAAAEVVARAAKPEANSRTLARLMRQREESPGADLASARGTWWGAVQAVTFDVDHYGSNRDTRTNSAWFGGGAARKNEAFALALELSGGEPASAPVAVAA